MDQSIHFKEVRTMNSLALTIGCRVNYARTRSRAVAEMRAAMAVAPMSTGTCHWFKRIPAVADSPPGVLEMV